MDKSTAPVNRAANDRGAFFALGGPPPGSGASSRRPPLPAATGAPYARMRFVVGPESGWLFPVGLFSEQRWGHVSADSRWAIGDLVMHDDDRCEAAFALLTLDARVPATQRLRRWAELDDWQLTVASGTRPLRPVVPTDWSPIVCTHCGISAHLSVVAMPYLHLISWKPTRCGNCHRGRRLPVPMG